MGYTVRLRPSAQKELDIIPEQDYRRISKIISALEQNPRPPKVKKLAGSDLWRPRMGNYRVVYVINDAEKVIIIVRVARRQEDTYKGL